MALGSVVHVVTISVSVTGLISADLVISLPGHDPSGDPFQLRVTSLPASGTLYQLSDGGRGNPIALGEPVTDPMGRVVFAPAPAEFGVPYSSFSFVATDSFTNSVPGLVTIHIIPIPAILTAQANVGPFGSFLLQFSGLTNLSYRVWASTNLTHWSVLLGTPSPVSPGVFQFYDSSAVNYPRRFYRVSCP
jgi:hypothetical protein